MNNLTILLMQVAIAIITTIIVYKTFDKEGLKAGFAVLLIAELSLLALSGSTVDAYELGIKFFLIFIAVKIILTLIFSVIEYLIYSYTSGAFAFLVLGGFTIYLASSYLNIYSDSVLQFLI